MSDRTKDIVDCTAMQVCKSKGVSVSNMKHVMKQHMKGIIVDVSQSHNSRQFTNAQGVHRCLTTSSHLYIYAEDRFAVGKEHLAFQGWVADMEVFPKGLSNRELRELAGEGMNLPCLASVLWAFFLVTPDLHAQ